MEGATLIICRIKLDLKTNKNLPRTNRGRGFLHGGPGRALAARLPGSGRTGLWDARTRGATRGERPQSATGRRPTAAAALARNPQKTRGSPGTARPGQRGGGGALLPVSPSWAVQRCSEPGNGNERPCSDGARGPTRACLPFGYVPSSPRRGFFQSRGNSHATIFYSKAGTDVPSAGEVLIYENDIVYA